MAEAQQLAWQEAEADRNALVQYQRDLEQYKVDYANWLEQQESDMLKQSKRLLSSKSMILPISKGLCIKSHHQGLKTGPLQMNGLEQIPS